MATVVQSTESPWTGAERRRSKRVLLVVPVEVGWQEDGKNIRHEAATEIVNAHGAVLRLRERPPVLTTLELTHAKTKQSITARVVDIYPPRDDGYVRMAVELSVPSHHFWGITIPPGDQVEGNAKGCADD